MSVPDFQSLMLPFLESLRDGQRHQIRDIYSEIAERMGLTEADMSELLPSGQTQRYRNRLSWAGVHLRNAGLVQSPARSFYQLTQEGETVLSKHPEKINVSFLNGFERYKEFRQKHQTKKGENSENNRQINEEQNEIPELNAQTPEEMLESGYQTLRDALAQELLERVKQATPVFFEALVVELLIKMGYGGSRKDAGKTVGRTGDGGIDGTINEDKLGLDTIYLQAKRWAGNVGRPEVQAFVGSLEGLRAHKGVMLTTSQFTADAKNYVTQIGKRIVLIDGQQLSELMIDYGLGVTTVATYDVRRIDSDYFSEE